MATLKINNLTKSFYGLLALENINMEIKAGELVGLIGPNGAGKTTLFNVISGVYEPTLGSVILEHGNSFSVDLHKKKPYQITGCGLARTFQNIRLFKSLTVLDNVLIAMHSKTKYNPLVAILRLPRFYQEEARVRKQAMALLDLVGLLDKIDWRADHLSYGEQRKLEIARAVATQPKILFLDEPAAGMNPQETAELTSLIKDIQTTFDLAVVLIEHDMSLVMRICERIYVLDHGTLIAEGEPEAIQKNPEVIKAYLGEDVVC
ncbi:MAG: ABC transporter ATP-binding protein [Erysipelotrichaceae bacterium]